ncbi:MAG: SH3 domain-containing protein [bacterium]
MKKTILAGVCAGTLVALSMGLVQSAPSSGTTLSVRSLKARLMASPEFLGSSVATLQRGARVKMISAKGSWYQVSHGATRGWVHKNRVTENLIKLSAGGTEGGTTRGEAELAGRGFSPTTEKAFKDKNPNLDYSHVDKIQGFDVEPDSVARFHQEGQVTGPQKGGAK